MPFANHEDYQENARGRYRARLANDPEFRAAESERKKKWYQDNKKRLLLKMRKKRAEQYRKEHPDAKPYKGRKRRTKR